MPACSYTALKWWSRYFWRCSLLCCGLDCGLLECWKPNLNACGSYLSQQQAVIIQVPFPEPSFLSTHLREKEKQFTSLIIQCFPPIPLYLSLCLNGKWQDISQYWWVPPFLKDERLNSCPLTLPHPCFVQVSLRAVVTPCTGLSMTQGSSLAGLHRCLREQGKEAWRGKTDTLGRWRKFQCLI